MRLATAAVCIFFHAYAVQAQVKTCGDPPPVTDETLKGEIQGRANMLTRFFGDAQITGQVDMARTDIFSHYPHAEQGRATAYFQYVLCALLFSDSSLDSHEKIETWLRIKDALGGGHKSSSPASGDARIRPNVQQSSQGKCSPNVVDVHGNVTVSGC
jgi:hypothetical protein